MLFIGPGWDSLFELLGYIFLLGAIFVIVVFFLFSKLRIFAEILLSLILISWVTLFVIVAELRGLLAGFLVLGAGAFFISEVFISISKQEQEKQPTLKDRPS